jgi:hypothetical protein
VPPTLYFPFDQLPTGTLTLFVRSKMSARDLMRGAQDVIAAIDPTLAAWQVQPVGEMLAASLAQRTFALEILRGSPCGAAPRRPRIVRSARLCGRAADPGDRRSHGALGARPIRRSPWSAGKASSWWAQAYCSGSQARSRARG